MNSRNTNVTAFLLEGKEPTRVALRLLGRDYSYGDLQYSAGRVAGYLLQRQAQKGDRILLVADNSFFWVAAYLGTLQAGMVCVALPTGIHQRELDYILRITEPRIAFVQAGFAVSKEEHFRGVHVVTDREVPSLPGVASQTLLTELCSDTGEDSALPQVCSDEVAALMFTSGSTQEPRGVVVSHANIMANAESIIQYLGLTPADRIMTVLPFHYCFGTSLLHTHLRVGGSLVIDLRFMYPEAILERMLETECTGFAGVPSHFQMLLCNSSLQKKHFPHLRYVQQAGGRLAPNLVRKLKESLPNTKIFVMYGQTEATARLSYLPPELLEKKLGSIGKAIPGVNLLVLNEAGQEVRPGEVGEIVAEGANVTHGYWRAPEESATTFRNGKLYTGDLATVDEEGFLYIVGRAKDFLKCGGKRVSCRALEDRLLESEEVLEAAVIGVPDDVLGEAVKAFVVPRNGNSAGLDQRLQDLCLKSMPHELVPREIIVLDVLPKNAAGKVLKRNLRS